MGRAVHRGRHVGPVHRVLGLRDLVPLRRARLRRLRRRVRPFHVDEEGHTGDIFHGLKGCTLCTRACPRFRTWEPDIEELPLLGRPRTEDEVSGISRRTVLARAADTDVLGTGQDGELVSALLIWALGTTHRR